MKRNKLILALIFATLGLAVAAGCAKKEEPAPAATEEQAADAMEEAADATAAMAGETEEAAEEAAE